MWSLRSRQNPITNDNLFSILNFEVDIFNRPKLVLFWMLATKETLKKCLETISPSLSVSLLSPFCLFTSFLPPYHTLKHPLPHPHKLTPTPTPAHTHKPTHLQVLFFTSSIWKPVLVLSMGPTKQIENSKETRILQNFNMCITEESWLFCTEC